MAKPRSYKLLCPVARGLDRIGDRWTLLILRDLHAGPARFTDLQRGLTGIAANLLTERLVKLVADGLVEKADGAHGASLYSLTVLGRKTRDILFELAMFGGRFPAEGDIVEPGNLRTVAFTMGAAAHRVAPDNVDLRAALIVDGEEMILKVENGGASVEYGRAENPDLVFRTRYHALLSVAEGEMSQEEFVKNNSELEVYKSGQEQPFLQVMSDIMTLLRA
ncbi:helix-turn-helix transcriptional regulator [Roseobacter sp. YSTF-M11]|uniref:Helix-turn-helix transcriptional regulator n=1 Tax=Roseobacter insulae TaxID=2859783 RepID=A0A9X1FRS7_9RHOB|nr:helix-turn-helix domain-containing protein [Roseobacter insulae]MBW4706596.1 helix-turn-helix transcriptional regulator [Roseobacter insulae]